MPPHRATRATERHERGRRPLRPRRHLGPAVRRTANGPARESRQVPHPPAPARDRFLALDEYRVGRELLRYEGTPQRDLFRELRTRFLHRHATPSDWVADVGSGPGRFSGEIGAGGSRRVLLDLSQEMLVEARRRHPNVATGTARFHFVRGDAAHPPWRSGRLGEIVLLGNVIGFSQADADVVLGRALDALAPGGTIVVETVVGRGERSRYLARLPEGAVRRLLTAPINLIRPRLEREGFRAEADPPKESAFQRMGAEAVTAEFRRHGVTPIETMAVAPALGPDADRIAAARGDPRAWRHLLELEEVLGRHEARIERAAALLIAGCRPPTAGATPEDRRAKRSD